MATGAGRLLKVLEYPHKLLRTECAQVPDVRETRIQELIRDMITTVRYHDGLGLAAPQIGEPYRLFVMRTPARVVGGRAGRKRYSRTKRYHACINPRIKKFSEEQNVYAESCLSIPDQQFLVRRKHAVQTAFTNADNEIVHRNLEGLPAVVFQHELDHLDGVLITDRELSITTGSYDEEFFAAQERSMAGLVKWYNEDPFETM